MSNESAVVERIRIIGRAFLFPHGCLIWESLPYCGTTRFGQWSCCTLLFSVLTYSTRFVFFLVCFSMDAYAADFTNLVQSSRLGRKKPIILFHLPTILSKCQSVSGKFIIYGNPCAFKLGMTMLWKQQQMLYLPIRGYSSTLVSYWSNILFFLGLNDMAYKNKKKYRLHLKLHLQKFEDAKEVIKSRKSRKEKTIQ